MERNLEQLEVDSIGRSNVILSLTFQLNQLLMMVNNPISFPHRAYVHLFNREASAMLAIYDITGIQEYIFATRWMKENAGASLIVTRLLRETLPKVLKDKCRELVFLDWQERENPNFRMSLNWELLAEVIYIGGGNAVVAYRNAQIYRMVTEAFAKLVLKQSYTLNLATAAIESNFQDYGSDKRKLDEKLRLAKARMLRQQPLGALPVVEQETHHGMPVTFYEHGEALSTLQKLKRQAYDAQDRKNLIYRRKLPKGVRFAVEMKDLIEEEGKNSYVAVVHIDGNGMGQKIRDMVEQSKDYLQAVPKMRRLSRQIAETYQKVFEVLVEKLIRQGGRLKRKVGEKDRLLQLRPLIMDGDDITFVCKASLALPVAAAFLRLLAREESELGKLSACAGIAMVHQNFPFDTAYELAEFCCNQAKRKRQDEKKEAGYLDYLLVKGAYVSDMKKLREQEAGPEQENLAGRLYNRPYCVTAEALGTGKADAFDQLQTIMKNLSAVDAEGSRVWPRSLLERLYSAYLEDEAEVQLLAEELRSRGRCLERLLMKNNSWEEKTTQPLRFFDALELMGVYDAAVFPMLLEEGRENEE